MQLSSTACYRAVLARDQRHDGRFFTCVRTTGIYCRPICPARPPKAENCFFVPTAAAAQEAGYRPCLRCRPESAPDLDAWRGTSATVSRALKLIESGALDQNDVVALADRLGIGERQLRRLFREHIGAAPVTVAQTRRVLLAKQLIHQTKLPMIQIASAAGFGSVRRFNETFQRLYHRPPNDLRRQLPASKAIAPQTTLLLPYRPPYDWDTIINFLKARAIAGVEVVMGDEYRRVIAVDGTVGTITVSHAAAENSLRVVVRFPQLSAFSTIITRVRRMFDLSADPNAISKALSNDLLLAKLVRKRPGLRLPGGWDGFEIAVRAILGQQITVGAATKLAARIVERMGTPVDSNEFAKGLTHAFPSPERFLTSAMHEIGMPGVRAKALVELANAAAKNPRLFDPRRDLDSAIEELCDLPGIGEWTAHYIAMRGMGETDAFLVADVGVHRALAVNGKRPEIAKILARAEQWRPWRAYAVLHLWMSENGSIKKRTTEKRHALKA